jgi:ribose 5-phosphate isomerase B
VRIAVAADVRIAVAADELTGIAAALPGQLEVWGHEPVLHGVYVDGEPAEWAWASERAARDVVLGAAEQAIVACWTGTGASIAANKFPASVRRCAATAPQRRALGAGNDANVLALSLRSTSEARLGEILDAWFDQSVSDDAVDARNIAHLSEIERGG